MPEIPNLLPVGNSWREWASSVAGSGAVRADSFVRHITGATFNAVVHGNLADRAKSFVVKSGHVERGAQFFIELAKILQVHSQRRQFQAIIGEQKFLITRIPQPRELSLDHN